MRKFLWILPAFWLSIPCLSNNACAATRDVPADYPTIQAAIAAATAGDTVLVADGTYAGTGNTNLDFGGKDLLVTSVHGPTACRIDGQNSGCAFLFHSGETAASRVEGFTIQNGYSNVCGGGLSIVGSAPTISKCVFVNNSATFGGGMVIVNGNPLILNCTFQGNTASDFGFGGGLYIESGSPSIINCLFVGNTALSNGFGGGIEVVGGNPIVTNCTLFGNATSNSGGGMDIGSVGNPLLTNCILWGNTASGTGAGIYNDSSSNPTVTYSDVQGGFSGSGNLYSDPYFFNALGGDLHLQPGSVCIDTGTASAPGLPAADLDGNPRIVNGVPDMGAYEFMPLATSLTVANVTGAVGQTVTLNAVLRRTSDNAVLPNKTVLVFLGYTYVGNTVTDSTGTAHFSYKIPDTAVSGTQTITFQRFADAQYNLGQATGTLTVTPANTYFTVANVSGAVGQTVTLSGVLYCASDNVPQPNKTVQVFVVYTHVGDVVTDSTGTGHFSYTIPGTLSVGTYAITFQRFGNNQYNAGKGTATLTVTP